MASVDSDRKSKRLRLTIRGSDRPKPANGASLAPTYHIESVGQLAGRDIVNQVTITQEIVELALAEIDRRPDVDDAMRRDARTLLERATGRGVDVLVAAAGTDVGAVALEAVKHILRTKGIAL